MLVLTPNAVDVVRDITTQEGVPPQAGLRISTPDHAQSFELAITEAPAEDDEVVISEGARVFLDQDAAAFLDDKILDTGLDPQGNTAFVIEPRADGTPTE
ncbi:hypothetical protein D7D52_14060 [Nocardia yunnanensis]|uniref:Fe-S cluster assembly protein HesB n=1 Tax=Nocardia yunnanensis TaxID=2382165 RepID=A0A386ZCH2_9NOCA|nr:hypothetical protein [Nocardia yunnanensis]AYF74804.1 hypothetical protein D7D52_14060 [Nocardia yunnanensis]